MQWLVDIDTAVADGTFTADAGAILKRRARDAMVGYAINLALFTGVVMVIGGAAAWLEDRRALAALGAALAVMGTLTLIHGGPRLRVLIHGEQKDSFGSLADVDRKLRLCLLSRIKRTWNKPATLHGSQFRATGCKLVGLNARN